MEFLSLRERNEEMRSISLRLFNDRLILVEPRVFFASVAPHSSFFFPLLRKLNFYYSDINYLVLSASTLPFFYRYSTFPLSNINYVIASMLLYFIIPQFSQVKKIYILSIFITLLYVIIHYTHNGDIY